MITNMLANAHLLYKTSLEDSMARKVQLMRRFCDVYYYNTEPLQSYEIVICALLLSSHNKCLSQK